MIDSRKGSKRTRAVLKKTAVNATAIVMSAPCQVSKVNVGSRRITSPWTCRAVK